MEHCPNGIMTVCDFIQKVVVKSVAKADPNKKSTSYTISKPHAFQLEAAFKTGFECLLVNEDCGFLIWKRDTFVRMDWRPPTGERRDEWSFWSAEHKYKAR